LSDCKSILGEISQSRLGERFYLKYCRSKRL